jgi:DNA-binding Lrp family transcriptional regulator
MDKLDHRILKELQDNFPLSTEPYDILAGKLRITPEQLWSRIQAMLRDGLIRRMGAILDSGKLGFSSTLAAVSIPADRVERAAGIIAELPEVTHSYLRSDEFNIWFTIVAPDDERLNFVLEHIRSGLCLERCRILNLPAKRLFKLDSRFDTTL